MNSAGRSRIFILAVAAVAIVVGLVLVGGAPRAEVPRPPAASQGPDSQTSIVDSAGEQITVRDYAELTSGLAEDSASADWPGLLLGLVAKLAFVIVLIYGAIIFLKRYVYRNQIGGVGRRPITALGSLSLPPNRQVYVLEVGRKVLVVGATQTQLSLLSEITDPEEIEEVRAQSATIPQIDQFSTLIQAARRRFGDGTATPPAK